MQTRIIVATLGERKTLKQTLKSIANQKITDLEVKIVIPKGKNDSTKNLHFSSDFVYFCCP